LTHRSKTRAVIAATWRCGSSRGTRGKIRRLRQRGRRSSLPMAGSQRPSAGTDAQGAAPAQGAVQVGGSGAGARTRRCCGSAGLRIRSAAIRRMDGVRGDREVSAFIARETYLAAEYVDGAACILFATNAEWRLRRVYQHGMRGQLGLAVADFPGLEFEVAARWPFASVSIPYGRPDLGKMFSLE